jgi:hypothetical protein
MTENNPNNKKIPINDIANPTTMVHTNDIFWLPLFYINNLYKNTS